MKLDQHGTELEDIKKKIDSINKKCNDMSRK